jgi:hypothetical protein
MVSPMGSRERQARQLVLASGALDAWAAKFVKYHTTSTNCQCPDWQIRGRRGEIGACKHMLALRLMAEREKDKP